MALAIANIERDFLVVGVLEEVKTTKLSSSSSSSFLIDTDGEDDSGDGVSHARVPDWAWSALGGQSGDEDYTLSLLPALLSAIR